MEPRPESGPGPMELGVEQGVDTCVVSCWDIWAIEEMGSNPLLLPMFGGPLALLDGVAGFNGRLSWGGMSWLGDTPPGNLPPGLAGTGNLVDSGPGDGVGKVLALSWLPGVCGVPGMGPPPGVWGSPGYKLLELSAPLVGVWGVVGPPGYLGGWSAPPWVEEGVWGPLGVPGPLQSGSPGVLG